MMRRVFGFTFFLFLMALSTAIFAQTTYEVKSHNLLIEGTSNIHDWTAEVEDVKGTFNLKLEKGKLVDIEKLSVKVKANSLKGSKGSIMDSKINDALNTKKHPEILFSLSKVNSISEASGEFKISTLGQLNISGVTKSVNLSAVGKITSGGEIEFTGSTKLKMSDFKVDPPTAMFGALTTGDEITLTYRVVVKPSMLSESK